MLEILFQIPSSMLDHFLHVIQTGYQKYPNAYHNHCHAAEVLQTVHYMLLKLDAVVSQVNRIKSSIVNTNEPSPMVTDHP